MTGSSISVLFSIIFTLLYTSSCAAGSPFFNLSWFLQDVVATTLIGKEDYEELRSLSPLEAEMRTRDRTEPTAIWIMRRPATALAVEDIRCDAFMLRTFADWQSDFSQDTGSVSQWRETFHGVSVIADYKSGYRGLKHVQLAAAVPSPGIPHSAFAPDGSGGLAAEFFEVAGTYVGAGFGRMREAMSPFEMALIRNETCDGYELYIWDFQK